jgi:hypothetical protein
MPSLEFTESSSDDLHFHVERLPEKNLGDRTVELPYLFDRDAGSRFDSGEAHGNHKGFELWLH